MRANFKQTIAAGSSFCDWLCQVDGAVFVAQDYVGFGFVIEVSERMFQRAIFSYSGVMVLRRLSKC